MKMKLKIPNLPKLDKVLNDKNVLYIVFILAILNVLGYLLVRNTEAIAFFLIVGFLTTYFSKNMIVILLISILSTSIFTSSKSYIGRIFKEGMTNKDKDKISKTDKNSKAPNNKAIAKKDANKSNGQKKENSDDDEDDIKGVSSEPNTKNKKGQNFISHADNLEEAYKNLKQTIGDGGIKGLTDQTQTLLNQQTELMSNIKGMEPFLQQAETFMNKLDLSSLDGIGNMLSKLGGKKE